MTFRTVFKNVGQSELIDSTIRDWRNPNQSLFLLPGEGAVFETDDPNHTFAPYDVIELWNESYIDETKPPSDEMRHKTRIRRKVHQRKSWKEHDPLKGQKWVVSYTNETESLFSYVGHFIGKIQVYPGIPRRFALSPLHPHAKFKKVRIVYNKYYDERARSWTRVQKIIEEGLRSTTELEELLKDREELMRKYDLRVEVPENVPLME